MSEVEVVAHELDHDGGVYRLVVGVPVYNTVEKQVEVDGEHPDAKRARDSAAAFRAQAEQVRADERARVEREAEEVEDPADRSPADLTVAEELGAEADRLDAEAAELANQPVYEVEVEQERIGTVPVEDFVFAADDERWEGMSLEEVAAAQRELVTAALAERNTPEPERDVEALPGAGTAL